MAKKTESVLKNKPVIPEIQDKKFKPHWVGNLPQSDYHSAHAFISNSGLLEARKSAAHFYHRVCLGAGQRSQTEAMTLGSHIHASVLEPERYAQNMILRPEFNLRTNQGKSDLLEWEKSLKPGQIVLTEEHREVVMNVLESVFKHKTLLGILNNSKKEISGFFREKHFGFGCRFRPDILLAADRMILDIKSTADASEEGFRRSIINYRYYMQAAFYLMGAEAIEGVEYRDFKWIAVEKTPPYCIEIYHADMGWLGAGEIDIQRCLKRVHDGLKTGEWPSYNPEGKYIGPPSWFLQKEEYSSEPLTEMEQTA